MKRLLLTLLLITTASPLVANLGYYYMTPQEETRLATANDLPTGIKELPKCYGYVMGELEQAELHKTSNSYTIILKVGGIWYIATKINFRSITPIKFNAENIGGFTLKRNLHAFSHLNTKEKFTEALRKLFGSNDNTPPARFITSSTYPSLRTNGFCPEKDLYFYDSFKISRAREFKTFHNDSMVEFEKFILSYSGDDHVLTLLHLSYTSASTILQDMVKIEITDDGEQTVRIRTSDGKEFANLELGPDFEIDYDIPQFVFTLEPVQE